MRRLLALLTVSGATLGVLLAVNTVAADSATPAPKVATVVISNFTFSGTLTVKPGTHMRVENHDSFGHTMTQNAGRFNTGVIPGGGFRGFNAPTRVGNYRFHCKIHTTMTGVLHVRA